MEVLFPNNADKPGAQRSPLRTLAPAPPFQTSLWECCETEFSDTGHVVHGVRGTCNVHRGMDPNTDVARSAER
jgi:hypothetical protein